MFSQIKMSGIKVEVDEVNISDYIGEVLTGERFNSLFPILSKTLVKLTNEMELHYGHRYVTGLNEDKVKFDPESETGPGGFSFTDTYRHPMWIRYNDQKMEYYRFITLPSDCNIRIGSYGFKADKIELGERAKISELPLWSDVNYCKYYASKYEWVSDYIDPNNFANEELQKILVVKDFTNIYILLNHNISLSEEVQLAAVTDNADAIKILLDMNIEIYEKVVIKVISRDISMLRKFITKRLYISSGVQSAAISAHGSKAIKMLCEHNIPISEKVKIEAVKMNGSIIGDLIKGNLKVSEEVQIAAVSHDENQEALKCLLENHIPISEAVQLAAVSHDRKKYSFIYKSEYAIRMLYAYDVPISRKVKIHSITAENNAFQIMLNYERIIRDDDVKIHAIKVMEEKAIMRMLGNGMEISEKVQMALVSEDGLRLGILVECQKASNIYSTIHITISEEVKIAAVKQNSAAIRYISDSRELDIVKKATGLVNTFIM